MSLFRSLLPLELIYLVIGCTPSSSFFYLTYVEEVCLNDGKIIELNVKRKFERRTSDRALAVQREALFSFGSGLPFGVISQTLVEPDLFFIGPVDQVIYLGMTGQTGTPYANVYNDPGDVHSYAIRGAADVERLSEFEAIPAQFRFENVSSHARWKGVLKIRWKKTHFC